MTIYLILGALALAVEAALTSAMLFAPGLRKKQLAIKCVCSGWFIVTGVAAALFAGKFSTYVLFVLLGLAASFWGDFFLQVENQERYFVVGVFCFMAAHVLYITAFSLAASRLLPGRPFLSPWQAAALAVMIAGLLVMVVAARMKLGGLLVPGIMYIAAISLMFVKAASLGIFAFVTFPAQHGTAALIELCAGALLFVISDVVLVFMIFCGKNTLRMRAVNLYTYFIAQALFALSIYPVA